jgi:DNA topoisomerase-1
MQAKAAKVQKVTVKRKTIHKQLEAVLVTDPVKSAKVAGLHYVCDDTPGIQRKRAGKGFSYVDVNGDRIQDSVELRRIKALAVPPALTEVWICPLPNGHLQATGRDAKGRKQYRYHTDWQKIRSQTKFNRMIPFGLALPLIRQTTEQHSKLRGVPREKVLAAVVRLLETTFIRIGNPEYAQKNKSFGLTTLRDRHVEISGSKIRFQFRGKSGVEHEVELSDRRLAKIIKSCRDIPGHELFQYIDEEGQRQKVGSEDVNDYLKEITGEEFTAKDFRTWAGTVLAAMELSEIGSFESKTAANRNVVQAVKAVAKQLGNRPTTCRKYYIHPAVIDAYLEGWLLPVMEKCKTMQQPDSDNLRLEEQAVLEVLEQNFANTGSKK